jgi:hypothetical protein
MLRKNSLTAVLAIGAIVLLLISTSAVAFANRNSGHAGHGGHGNRADTVLEWKTMVGVPQGLVGALSQAPLRGINGGGIPWTLDRGRGELKSDGRLEIEVRGLVLATGASAGTNPSATFRGLVSCVNADGTFSNVLTDPFPATTGPASLGGGNSRIRATLTLPSSCIAPIVFVTSATGSWFAATGF